MIILDTVQQQIIMPQPRLKYLPAISRCIHRGTPRYEYLAVIGRQWNVLAKPDRKIGLLWGCESIKHRGKAGGETYI